MKKMSKKVVFCMVVCLLACFGMNVQAAKAPREIRASYTKLWIGIGEIRKVTIQSVKPANASKKVTWKSKNPKIATVSKKGEVTGKKKGNTYIIATSKKNKKVKVKIRVKVRNMYDMVKPEQQKIVMNFQKNN